MLVKIQGESMSGVRTWMVHRDNLPLLQRAADGDIRAERTTFLAPFDSLFWAWDRDEMLWGFKQLLECYKPAAQTRLWVLLLPDPAQGSPGGALRSEAGSYIGCAPSAMPST